MLAPSNHEDRETRAALIGHMAEKLQPIFVSHNLSQTLSGWLAKLPNSTLAKALHQDANATADALALSLVGGDADDIDAELTVLAETEFPRHTVARRREIVNFAITMRRVAIDGDGTAKAADLYAEDYTSRKVAELTGPAQYLLALLGGTARRRKRLPEDHTTPAARLAAAGARAALGIRSEARA